ncbi:helix-turn-helix domain-containing protein [Bacteroides fragilis]|nr:helix-turn-helix domain-containing protein [Bacteroides fragilis]
MVRIDGKSMLLPERTFLFLPPGHLLLRFSCTQDFLFQYLSFSFDFLSDFPLLLKADISNQVTNAPCLPMSPEDFSLIKMYYHFIYHRYLDAECPSEVIKGMLFSLVLEVCRMYSGRNISVEMSRQDKLVDGFFSLLHKYCTQERMAAFYASRLCISDKYLMRSIKKQTGQTFHYWMADFILREAKLMLRSTDLSVTEIADKLSFPNSSSFARFFRKYTGFSPVQFRNEA